MWKAVVKGGGRVATGLKWAGVDESSEGCGKTRSLRVKSVGLLVTLWSFMGQLVASISFLYPPTTSYAVPALYFFSSFTFTLFFHFSSFVCLY